MSLLSSSYEEYKQKIKVIIKEQLDFVNGECSSPETPENLISGEETSGINSFEKEDLVKEEKSNIVEEISAEPDITAEVENDAEIEAASESDNIVNATDAKSSDTTIEEKQNFIWQSVEEDDDINLFDLNNQVSSNVQEQNSDDVMLPGFEDETPEPKFEQLVENKPVDFFKRDFNNDLFENNEMPQLPGMESFNNNKIVESQEEISLEEKNEYEENGGYLGGDLQQNNTQNLTNSEMNNYSNSFEYFNKNNQIQGSNVINTVANSIQNENTVTSNLVTSDCKIVSFVGTSKNGTSFLVNNLAVFII